MKNFLLLLMLISPVHALAAIKIITYKVEPSGSQIRWTGTKAGGGTHTGTVKIKEGTLKFVDGKPTRGSIVIDMKSISNDDIDEKNLRQILVNHLISSDFFGVEDHPHSTLDITDIDDLGGGKYLVHGMIAIKGYRKKVSFSGVEKSSKDNHKLIEANLDLDRTDFHVRYGSGKFFQNLGDSMISDKFNLTMQVTLVAD